MLLALALLITDCVEPADNVDAAVLRYALGWEQLKAGATQEGLATLRALSPTMPAARWAIASEEEARGHLTASYSELKLLLRAAVNEADKKQVRQRLAQLETRDTLLAQYAGAERLAATQEWPEIVNTMHNIIAKQPTFALAHRLLAIALSAQNNADFAAAAYRQYLALEANSPDRPEIERFLKAYAAARN